MQRLKRAEIPLFSRGFGSFFAPFKWNITAIFFCYAIYKEMPGGSDETVIVTDKGVSAEGPVGHTQFVFMARKKIYTEKSFFNTCENYFKSISALRPVQELYDTGRTNKKGLPVMAYRDVIKDSGKEAGKPLMQRVYFVPPSMLGLYLYLGVSKQTASNYRKQGGLYEEALEAAELKVEEYKARALNEGIKRPQGIIFDLQCNHGWTAEKKDSSGEGGGVIVLPEISRPIPPNEAENE